MYWGIVTHTFVIWIKVTQNQYVHMIRSYEKCIFGDY